MGSSGLARGNSLRAEASELRGERCASVLQSLTTMPKRLSLRFAQWSLFLILTLNGCQTQESARTEPSAPAKPNVSEYTIAYTVVINGDEFITVVVPPGVPDPDLMSVATELHILHPRSNITFYDSMDQARFKQYWQCLADTIHKIDNPSCPDGPDEWLNAHRVGSVGSFYGKNDPNHAGPPKWELYGRGYTTIGVLGVDDRPAEKPTLKPAPQRPQIGETVKLKSGDKIMAAALTPDAYGEYTRCFDVKDTINCEARLLDQRRTLQVPSGTSGRVLAFRDNPYRASSLKGGLIQVRILEGALRGQAVWTLESRVGRP